MVSPSFAIRDPRGRAPFPSRSRLCRSARGARVYNRRLVRGNFKTEFYGHESEVHDSSKTPRAIPYGQTVLPVSNHRALTLAKEAQSRSADYLRRSQLRARRQVAASHTRRRTSSAGRTPRLAPFEEDSKTADVPSGGTTARGEDLERVKKQHGRHRRQPQLPRGGSRAHVRTVGTCTRTSSIARRGHRGPTPADCNPEARPRPLSIVTKKPLKT